jgi:hypothetical protein
MKAGAITFRLGVEHRKMFDDLLADDPGLTQTGIFRAALEEYVARHRGSQQGAA